ncbi:MAG TPA: alpha/beta hydrolase [Candidatus Saccharimonadales bacterium]|nr:alpha/beta hydrolase [Candidatus Saccharimonadales bacterium]
MRVTTPSFRLAVYTVGDPQAPRLALCLPGYCDTKDYPDLRTHADLLAARGYYAVAFDPPGTWGSGDIALYTTTNYLKAIDELVALYGARPTLLLGKSMGGRMAQLGAQNPAVCGLVSVVGSATGAIADDVITEEAWVAHPRHAPHRDLPNDPTQFRDFTIPYSFVEDAARYDALAVLPSLQMPKLYIAGQDDTLVPPEKLRRAYDAAGDPKKFVVLPMGHDYRKDPAQLKLVNDTIAQWLSENNL